MKALGLTDGSAGMAAQVRALAEAMNCTLKEEKIAINFAWKYLPNAAFLLSCFLPVTRSFPDVAGYDVVISCGRKAALVSAALRKKVKKNNGATTKFIHIQDPQMSPTKFDMVIAMAHDKVDGANVIKTYFALHNITDKRLAAARVKWEAKFSPYPSSRCGVLFGGSTNKYQLNLENMQEALIELRAAFERDGGSLLITTSRRTGIDNIFALHSEFYSVPNVMIFDGDGDNPYAGILALSDVLIVTNDSVNMMSEAYATGKPLYILRLQEHVDTKPADFAEMLVEMGSAQWLNGDEKAQAHIPELEMEALAGSIREIFSELA